MFEFVGKHKRLLQLLLMLILIPPFAFFGIQSFDRLSGGSAIFNADRAIGQGCLAQLVERRPYKANVGGSIPSAPTRVER